MQPRYVSLPRTLCTALFLAALILTPLWSQDQAPVDPIGPPKPPAEESQPSTPEEPVVPEQPTPEADPVAPVEATKDTLEQRLKTVEESPLIEEDAKAELVQRYREAIQFAEEAARYQATAKLYRDALTAAPVETQKLVTELDAFDPPEVDPNDPVSILPKEVKQLPLEQLDQKISTEDVTLKALERELAGVREKLALEENTRPAQLQAELQTARSALEKVESELAALKEPDAPDESATASRMLLLARRQAQQTKIEMLEQEQLSREARVELLFTKRDLFEEKVEAETQMLAAMRQQALRFRLNAANTSRVNAEQALERVPEGNEVLMALAEELLAWSKELQEVQDKEASLVERNAQAAEREKVLDKQIAAQTATMEQSFFGPGLLEEARNLEPTRITRQRIRDLEAEYNAAKWKRQAMDEASRKSAIRASRPKEEFGPPDIVGEVLAQRQEMIPKLRKAYNSVMTESSNLINKEQDYLETVRGYRQTLRVRLFWVPSSAPAGAQTIADLDEAVVALANPSRLTELWTKLQGIFLWRWAILLVVVLGLLGARPRMIKQIEALGAKTRKTSQDKWSLTGRTLLLTAALPFPFPLIAAYVGWELSQGTVANPWLYGLANALLWVAAMVLGLGFMLEVARPKGLADRHFAWNPDSLRRFRKDVRLLGWTYIPMFFVVMLTLNLGSSSHFDSLGRLVLVLAMLMLAFVLKSMFSPKRGVLAGYLKHNPDGWAARLTWAWYPILILGPLMLAFLALSGRVLTAYSLNYRFELTAACLAAGAVLFGLVLRIFTINERKLALKKALEQWKQRKDTAQEEEETEEGGDEVPDFDTEQVDMQQVGEQTRSLLKFAVGLATAVGIWGVWANVFPVLQELDEKPIVGELTWAGLITGSLIAVATLVISRNLPGILEMVVLRNLPIEAGSRTAFATLAGYTVFAIGFALALQNLGLNWASFGWIAAALSVGLGFGLQEVVANFVCGIILLFERPIRVGDIVTVGEVTGIVSRIQIRATTITDWDRKEFVVPNKSFVTGTLMNWTLTNKVNRIVIPIGLAYGSDTDKARAVLFDICKKHPLITEDPKPLVTFEGFGDSSLNMILRCYLPNLDERLEVIHQLHTMIHKRFMAEGIEIAFPQMDIHVRDVPPNPNGSGAPSPERPA